MNLKSIETQYHVVLHVSIGKLCYSFIVVRERLDGIALAYDKRMYNAKTLKNRLHIARRDLGWDQVELSQRSGVSRGYISEIERGVKQNVGIEVVFSLAEALGVSVEYLLGLSDAPIAEPSMMVLRETAGEYVTVDVDNDDERRLIRSLIAEFNALPRRAQEAAIEMIRILRKVEEEDEETVG